MIWTFLVGNPIARVIGKILALALAVLTFGAWQRRQGQKALKGKQAEATLKAVQKGAEGAAEAVTQIKAGKTPQQVKEGNDARW